MAPVITVTYPDGHVDRFYAPSGHRLSLSEDRRAELTAWVWADWPVDYLPTSRG